MLSAKIRARFHRKYIGGFHSWFLCTQVGSICLQAILADLGRGRWVNRKGELAQLGAFPWSYGALSIASHCSVLFRSPGATTSLRLPVPIHAITDQPSQDVVMDMNFFLKNLRASPAVPWPSPLVSLTELDLSCHIWTLVDSMTLFLGPLVATLASSLVTYCNGTNSFSEWKDHGRNMTACWS